MLEWLFIAALSICALDAVAVILLVAAALVQRAEKWIVKWDRGQVHIIAKKPRH